MSDTLTPLIQQDWNAFHPWRVGAVQHRVFEDPLLQMDSLLALGRRLEAAGQLLGIDKASTAGTTFTTSRADVEGLEKIGENKGWAILRYVQNDPIYRKLVDSVLDSIRPQLEPKDPGMHYRAGFIFVSAQHSVTPFHFDVEHNFILQMHGRKRLYVWDPDDLVVASEQARNRFHYDRNRDLLVWREEFRERAHVFDLEPGQGAYMPSTSPHMVETGSGLSITMSFTYFTHATRRDALLHKLHYMAQRAHIEMPAVGRHPRFDDLTEGAATAATGVRRLVRRLTGHPISRSDPPYAGVIQS
jgi:ribosomal protein L16 Arg81 hydroxylase